jgi:hypothetical protein
MKGRSRASVIVLIVLSSVLLAVATRAVFTIRSQRIARAAYESKILRVKQKLEAECAAAQARDGGGDFDDTPAVRIVDDPQ